MACTSFIDCVNDPLVDNNVDAANTFQSLGTAAVYSINVSLYIFYLLLTVAVAWFIFKGVYAIIGADSADSYEKFRGAITNAVFAAVGIILIGGARFFFIMVLKLIGVDDAQNIFMDNPLNALLGL